MQDASNTYDDLPYPGMPFPQTHPLRLATIATLFGMDPPAVETCRVLEIGCTDGGNLIPMAVSFPDAEFVGIDLSQRQIETGLKTIAGIGLSNIRLVQQNILEVADQYGTFDYIIAHGVYSWVPADVQEKILTLTKQLLTPQGVGYVSYNTYPGWRMRGMLRDMMLFHTRQFSDDKTRIEQARAMIDFLAKAVPADSGAYGLLLSDELENMQSWPDSYIFHESLEAHNEPLYFHQFAARASASGLRYLGEANLSVMLPTDIDEETIQTLSEIGRDIIEMEQYMDFVRNRTFRQTLLCHDTVELDRTLTPDVCHRLQVRGRLTPAAETPDITNGVAEEFQSEGGTTVTVRAAIQKAAFLHLAQQWPVYLPFTELLEKSRAALRSESLEFTSATILATEESDLSEALFECFCDHLIELQVSQANFATNISECPKASPLAKYQAAADAEWVTTLTHDQVRLDAVTSQLIRHLDGTRTLDEITALLTDLTKDGTIVAMRDGSPVTAEAEVTAALRSQIESRLTELCSLGLLVS